jgi:hypothetical protein
MQHIGALPAFGRFDFGEFGNLNTMYEQYWQANAVQASSADDTKDETLYSRFIRILEWIIQTRLAQPISLGPKISNLLFVMPQVSSKEFPFIYFKHRFFLELVQLWKCFYQFKDYRKAKFYIHDEDQGKQFMACIDSAAATSPTSPVSDLIPAASPATSSVQPLSPVDPMPADSLADSIQSFPPAPSSTSQS